MAIALREEAEGVVDGVNRAFKTSTDYQPGTLVAGKNGLFHRSADDDGWTELGGRDFELDEAPEIGETVVAHYTVL